MRSALIGALVAQMQRMPDPLWSSILLDAFRGMLGRLSRLIQGPDKNECDALVAASFLEALAHVRPERDPSRIAMYVRQETRRRAFAALGRDSAWLDVAFDVEADGVPDALTLGAIEDRIRPWRRTAEEVTDEELLSTQGRRGALRRLVRHVFSTESPREQQTFYRMLVRRRSQLLGSTSPTGERLPVPPDGEIDIPRKIDCPKSPSKNALGDWGTRKEGCDGVGLGQ